MSDFARLFLLLALAGGALTAVGAIAVWYMDEDRRMRRALRRVLGAQPDSLVVARGRGQAAGFSLSQDKAAVAWDGGAWCLVYRLEELQGAELLVDGQVGARAFRGEARRALDQVSREAQHVALRLVFDDPKDPDFILDLWRTGDDARAPDASPAKAIQEANRWIARVEALLRRPVIPRPGAEPARPLPAPPPAAAPAAPPPPVDEEPPWDDDEAPDDDEDAQKLTV